MAEYFYYPNTTGATKTLTFESGAGTNGHLQTDGETIIKNQIQDVTIGGVRMAKNLGDDLHQWEYTVIVPASSTSYTDQADIESFIGSSYANGAVSAFHWVDSGGTTRTVSMINNSFSFQRISGDKVKVTFLLEQENT